MSKRLPRFPNLGSLRNQAKQLRQACLGNDPDARRRFQSNHPQFSPSDPVISIRLTDAQWVIAREYGFDSWPKLKQHAEAAASGLTGAATRPPEGPGMKPIFANLYRFDSKPRGKAKRVSYSYLLVRKQDNLLVWC